MSTSLLYNEFGLVGLEDYLIPVIKKIYQGHDYLTAFHATKEKLDVRYNTASFCQFIHSIVQN
jgi:hypothetical protein